MIGFVPLFATRLLCSAGAALPWLRFEKVMIPAVKKHYKGKGIKKFFICCDGCKAFNNADKARDRGQRHCISRLYFSGGHSAFGTLQSTQHELCTLPYLRITS